MHHGQDIPKAECAVLVVSDTRSLSTDEGGVVIERALQQAGHVVVERRVVPDEQPAIQAAVRVAQRAQVIVLTGGSGFGRRDVTPEAIRPLLDREMPGFGEAFRRLSYDAIGPAGLLSRALAGTLERSLVFVVPGSPRACATAMELALPLIPHVLGLLSR